MRMGAWPARCVPTPRSRAMGMDVTALCRAAAEEATAWRRHLHEHPELGFEEFETTAFIEEKLRSFGGFRIERPCPTGLVAVLAGSKPGKAIALRADIDALPIQEDPRNDPCSQVPGVMHACGHDGHAAALLGAAKVLSSLPADTHGELRFFFQPAEEKQPGGAKGIVEAGWMEGVDLIYGMHFQSQEEVGTLWLKKGPLLASTYTFDIQLRGKGTHAAFPHLGTDTILAASQLVVALNQITSRSIDPTARALLTVAAFEGGNSYNSLPELVTLRGTIRILDRQCEAPLLQRVRQVVGGIEALYGVSCSCEITKGYGVLENDPQSVEHAKRILAEHFGQGAIFEPPAALGGEDFSAYLEHAPGCYYRVGARKRKPDGSYYPSHQSRHEINDDALFYAIASEVYLALD